MVMLGSFWRSKVFPRWRGPAQVSWRFFRVKRFTCVETDSAFLPPVAGQSGRLMALSFVPRDAVTGSRPLLLAGGCVMPRSKQPKVFPQTVRERLPDGLRLGC